MNLAEKFKSIKVDEAIHTPVPTIAKGDVEKQLKFLLDSNNVYKSAIKLIKDAKAFSLKDSSSFGATLWLEFGKDSGKEPEQLSKKKINWGDLVFYFYGDIRDQAKVKQLKSELMKHGLVIIK